MKSAGGVWARGGEVKGRVWEKGGSRPYFGLLGREGGIYFYFFDLLVFFSDYSGFGLLVGGEKRGNRLRRGFFWEVSTLTATLVNPDPSNLGRPEGEVASRRRGLRRAMGNNGKGGKRVGKGWDPRGPENPRGAGNIWEFGNIN